MEGTSGRLRQTGKLINELEPDDKAMVFRLIDTIVTKKKFKDFFQENITIQK